MLNKVPDNAVMLIEIRGNYDGWSVAKLDDGTLLNRWSPEDRFYKAAQEYIDNYKEEEE